MIYLASPYTHKDADIVKYRYDRVLLATAHGLKAGLIIYSPIVHCHELASVTKMPTDFDFWKSYNFGMLRHAEELCVYTLPGWQESKGVTAEIGFAQLCGIPITTLSPAAHSWQSREELQ